MTRSLECGPDLVGEMLAHAAAELPNEACGLLVGTGHKVIRFHPVSNVDASPVSYTVSPEEHFRILRDAEDQGLTIVGVFHSHPGGTAAPSATDVRKALEPGWAYVIAGAGMLRAWAISDGRVDEIALA